MAKKKVAKKSAKKRNSSSFLKSNKFLFGVAIVLAIAVIAGLTMFAGGAKNKGRIFSWREGTVKENYKIQATAPDPTVWQHVMYTRKEWNGAYYGVYTEVTTPAYASRDLKPGMTGQDVLVLKAALKYIGQGYVLPPNGKTPATISSRCPAMLAISAGEAFDQTVTDAVKNCLQSTKLSTSFDSYVEKNGSLILSKYELARILTLATHPGLLNDGRALTFTMAATGGNIGDGSVSVVAANATPVAPAVEVEVAPAATDSTEGTATEEATEVEDAATSFLNGLASKAYAATNFYYRPAYYNGQKVYGASPVNLTSGVGFVVAGLNVPTKITRSFTNTLSKNKGVMKGDDVKEAQAMLLSLKSKYPGIFSFKGLKVNGNYDTATKNAVKEYRIDRMGTKAGGSGYLNGQMLQLIVNDIAWPLYR